MYATHRERRYCIYSSCTINILFTPIIHVENVQSQRIIKHAHVTRNLHGHTIHD